MTDLISRIAAIFVAAAFALVLAGCDAPSDSGSGADNSSFVGNYTTKDTKGNDMAITLADEGAATGTLEGKTLTGSWKVEGDTVTITWTDGWTTKLTKDGDGFNKTAFKGGKEEGSMVPAEKAQ
ncbi:MAG: hypothetical protein AAF405_02965 [Pseudomonadota bacterium]